ncbi:MAG: response regulator, partial [Pseudomonadota bacterium]
MSDSPMLPKALIVDDDAVTRLMLAEAVGQIDFEVLEAGDGNDGLDIALREHPSLILLDIDMPGRNGYELCKMLRQVAAFRFTPIMMITGNDDVDSVNRAYECGATDFVAKPINWALLQHRLRYVVRAAGTLTALHAREAENRALLRSVPDTIVVCDDGGQVLKCLNGVGNALLKGGDGAGDVGLDTLFDDATLREACPIIAQVAREGGHRSLEYAAEDIP